MMFLDNDEEKLKAFLSVMREKLLSYDGQNNLPTIRVEDFTSQLATAMRDVFEGIVTANHDLIKIVFANNDTFIINIKRL